MMNNMNDLFSDNDNDNYDDSSLFFVDCFIFYSTTSTITTTRTKNYSNHPMFGYRMTTCHPTCWVHNLACHTITKDIILTNDSEEEEQQQQL
jgi:hypothetical protein